MQDFHLTASQLGGPWFCIFFSLLYSTNSPGLMIDRIGPKKSVLIGIGLCTLGSFVFSQSDNFALSPMDVGIDRSWFRQQHALLCKHRLYLLSPKNGYPLMLSLTICVGSLGGMMGNQFLKDTFSHNKWQDVMEYMSCGMVVVFLATLFYQKRVLSSFRTISTHKRSPI